MVTTNMSKKHTEKSSYMRIVLRLVITSFITVYLLAIRPSYAQSPTGITSVEWSPDGTKVAYGGTGGLLRIVTTSTVKSQSFCKNRTA